MTREIPLTRGFVAIIDDTDFEWLSQWKWQAKPHRRTAYAVRAVRVGGKRIRIFMHREILGCAPGEVTDHKNRDGLDNRRANLRTCTARQNSCNSVPPRKKSPYRGICKLRRRWRAQIKHSGRQWHLGLFLTPEEAARVYDAAARLHHGEFAVLNFPPEGSGA